MSKRKSSIEELIIRIVLLSIVLCFFLYHLVIKPHLGELFLIVIICTPFILAAIAITFFVIIRGEQKKISNTPALLIELENKIRSFTPLRNYPEERLYHTELAGFLKSSYPNLCIEVAKDYSRPDIVIDNIAIEIKGPTDMGGLKSLPDKINSYLPRWDYLFIVLFNAKIEEDLYNQKISEILENTIESKKEKIFIIRID